MRSRKLLALLFCLITFPAIAGYMTLLGAGVGSIAPVVSWVSTTDPTFPSSSLTYSGPSLSTMFDSTGKLTYAPNNLLTYSNTFSNAAWTKSGASVASGAADPLGGTAGWTITDSAATASHIIFQAQTFSSSAYVAVYMKAGTLGFGMVRLGGSSGAAIRVNLTTGAVTAIESTDLAASGATSVGNGWWLAWVKGTSSADNIPQFGPNDGSLSTSYTGTGSGTILAYAANASQVTYETTPRTADQVITTSSAYYGPRIDYDPNTLAVKGLLIEEARTNLSYPSLVGATWASTGMSITANNAVSYDGTTNGALLTESAGAAQHEAYSGNVPDTVAGSTYTYSFFIKPGTRRYIQLSGGGSFASGAFGVVVDTTTNPVSVVGTGANGTASYTSSSVQALSAGFYRVNVTGVASSTTGYALIDGVGSTAWSSSPTSSGSQTVYVADTQIELGSFGTSLIRTAAASVTRAADVVQFTGAALTALQGSAGSVIVQSISEASSSPTAITNVIKGTNSILYRDTTGKTGTTNGTTALLTAAAPTWSSAIRNGLAWSASGRSLGYTSSAIATDANTVSNGGTLYLGSSAGSAVESGWYQSLGIWNQRLPDATLSTKLTVGGPYAANDNANPFAPKFADNDNLPIHWRVAL